MPAPPDDEDVETPADAWASQARRWGRAALALVLLFASLPLVGKPIFGGWEFDGALAIAFWCMIAAAYLYFVERTGRPPIPDPAAIPDAAIRRAAAGETEMGLALLDEALRPELPPLAGVAVGRSRETGRGPASSPYSSVSNSEWVKTSGFANRGWGKRVTGWVVPKE